MSDCKEENSLIKSERRILNSIATLSKIKFSSFGSVEQKEKLLIKFHFWTKKLKHFIWIQIF